MGSVFSSPKPQGPDPELVRQRQEAEAKAAKEKADREAREAEEKAAKERGLRGRVALLSNDLIGFSRGLDTLGA